MARNDARSSAIMAAGTLVSRILGFVKTILLTVAIGSLSTVGDVFETANTLPNLIYVLVAGGVFNAVLVPQIIKAAKAQDGGARYISKLVTLTVTAIGLITIITVACAWPIISIMGSGWSPEQRQLGFIFSLWCLPQIFFYGLYTVIGQVLNAKDAFGAYMWSPVLNNVITILSLILFIFLFGAQTPNPNPIHTVDNWTNAQTLVLAGSSTFGVIMQALVLFIPLRKLGLRLKPVDDAHDAVGLTEAHALKERVEIESGVARDGLTELFGGDLALRMEKRELFDLLCGSKEVALHHIGEVVERLGGHDELVAGESCLEPGGELCAFHGRAVYDGGLALKRPPPRLLRDRPVGGGHRDERDDAVDRVVKILHDGGRAG